MDDHIMVSVHMITYNHEKYIQQAIEGVLMQETAFPIELIISDDCSTDNTPEIISKYAEQNPNIIRVIHREKNMGVMYNFTDTFNYCRGKYIAVCEGDDYWTDPLKLQKQVDFMEGNEEYSMCFHNVETVYFGLQKKELFIQSMETKEYTGNEILANWLVPTCSVLYRADRLDSKKFINSKYIYGDLVLFLNLAKAGKLWGMRDVMGVYRKHPGGVTSKQNSISFFVAYKRQSIEIYRNFREFASYKYKKQVSMICLRLAWRQLKDRQFGCFSNLCSALCWSPIGFWSNVISHVRKKY